MILRKKIILNIFLFILFICVVISYIYEVRRTDELREEMSMENLLGQEHESSVNRAELALKFCEGEIQRKLAYIDNCKDFNVKQEQINNLEFNEGLQEILKIGQEKLDKCFENRNGLKSKYPDCFPKSPVPDEENIFINGSSVNKIKNFMLLLGDPRCGSTILRALLDSHPHVIFSTTGPSSERIWLDQLKKQEKFDRYDLFNILRAQSIHFANRITRNLTRKYYTLDVPGLQLGEFTDYIQVFGDTRGRFVMDMDDDSKELFQMMDRFQNFVGCPVKFFYLVRNPYDIIATMYLYKISPELRQELITNNETLQTAEGLRNTARNHIASFKMLQRHIDHYGERMITVYNEDLISNPKLFMKRMCNHMEIYCSNYYIEKTSEKAFSSATKSRHSVEWKQDVIDLVDNAIKEYPFLNRYSFED